MQWVIVRSYLNEAEAALAIASLEASEIPAELRSAVPAIGLPDFAVLVPPDRLSQAHGILGNGSAKGRSPRIQLSSPAPAGATSVLTGLEHRRPRLRPPPPLLLAPGIRRGGQGTTVITRDARSR